MPMRNLCTSISVATVKVPRSFTCAAVERASPSVPIACRSANRNTISQVRPFTFPCAAWMYCTLYLKYVAPNVRELLSSAHVDLDTPDYFIFHQANRVLNECLLKKLGIAPHKAPETLLEYGNTSCATIPVTICRHLGSELANGRKQLVISGFGAGFSWGSALLSTESVLCPDLLEIDSPAN